MSNFCELSKVLETRKYIPVNYSPDYHNIYIPSSITNFHETLTNDLSDYYQVITTDDNHDLWYAFSYNDEMYIIMAGTTSFKLRFKRKVSYENFLMALEMCSEAFESEKLGTKKSLLTYPMLKDLPQTKNASCWIDMIRLHSSNVLYYIDTDGNLRFHFLDFYNGELSYAVRPVLRLQKTTYVDLENWNGNTPLELFSHQILEYDDSWKKTHTCKNMMTKINANSENSYIIEKLNQAYRLLEDGQSMPVNYTPKYHKIIIPSQITGFNANQTIETEDNNDLWYALKYKGKLYLIMGNVTTFELALSGQNGYDNAFSSMDLCSKAYENEAIGTKASIFTYNIFQALNRYPKTTITKGHWIAGKRKIYPLCNTPPQNSILNATNNILETGDLNQYTFKNSVRPVLSFR